MISFVSDAWQDEKGKPESPAYNSIVDVEACDGGWEESLMKLGFKPERNPATPGYARVLPLNSQGSSYIHMKGFKERKRR